ncbi:MAG TPA: histidine phosphatase family protein [Rhizomicrobium sp.]|nr:histidine phosphatase family protein [Rhizomicrobium sp.]
MPLSLSPGLTLYFCRHGETEANVQRRFQGRSRDTALTEKGHAQARTIAAILKRVAPDHARLAYVASPLKRARATKEIILDQLGLPRDRYATDDRIVEMNLGRWEGLTEAEARADDPVAYEHRATDKWEIPIPGGESYSDVAVRARNWIADLKADTFAVTHGGFLRILRGLFHGMTWREMSGLDEPQGVLYRASGSSIERIDQE